MGNDEARALAQSLAILAWEERRDRVDDHPTPERLAAYHSGELSAQEDLEIQKHLVLCTDCPALLLDLEDLFDPRRRDLGLSDTGVTSAWRDLRSRLGGWRGGKGGLPPAAPARSWWSWLSVIPSPAYAAATGLLLLLTTGLTGRIAFLERNQAVPEANSPIIILEPSGERGFEPEVQEFEITSGSRLTTIKIKLPASWQPPYSVWILGNGGEVIASFPDLGEPQEELLPVSIPTRLLKPGRYEAEISRPHQQTGRKVVYVFDVVYRDSPAPTE